MDNTKLERCETCIHWAGKYKFSPTSEKIIAGDCRINPPVFERTLPCRYARAEVHDNDSVPLNGHWPDTAWNDYCSEWEGQLGGCDDRKFIKVSRANDCPSIDTKTDAEIEAERQELSELVDMVVKNDAKIAEWKRKMLAYNLKAAKAKCPECQGESTVTLVFNLEGNQHMWAKCKAHGCKFMFME